MLEPQESLGFIRREYVNILIEKEDLSKNEEIDMIREKLIDLGFKTVYEYDAYRTLHPKCSWPAIPSSYFGDLWCGWDYLFGLSDIPSKKFKPFREKSAA